MATPEFQAKSKIFYEKYGEEKKALEKCLETKVNDDINFVCREQKSAYLLGLADFFCKEEYDTGVKCQKAAGDAWASKCFNENVKFGQCVDKVLKQLYVYGIISHQKNPASTPTKV
eukprot:Tbor_TRINITY_DN5236_c2_g4::TRINITY_DN5236_c2_g4_i1::g.16813::m.16813